MPKQELELELEAGTTKLGEQESLAQGLEVVKVEQETKVENISQGTVKQELEIKIETEEKVDSTMMVKQEGL